MCLQPRCREVGDDHTGRSTLDILGLKKYLSHQVGCSRFRQRILNGSAGELFDDREICAPVGLQIVILVFWPSDEHEDATFVAACQQSELERAEGMLQRPQNPDVRDRDGWPAVRFAAQMGTASCMELLLESRADLEIRATEDASTALHYAVFNGHPEVRCCWMQVLTETVHWKKEQQHCILQLREATWKWYGCY